MQSAFDENQGACLFTYVEASGWFESRGHSPQDLRLPAAATDANSESEVRPFDGRLVGAIRRTASGFDLNLYTR